MKLILALLLVTLTAHARWEPTPPKQQMAKKPAMLKSMALPDGTIAPVVAAKPQAKSILNGAVGHFTSSVVAWPTTGLRINPPDPPYFDPDFGWAIYLTVQGLTNGHTYNLQCSFDGRTWTRCNYVTWGSSDPNAFWGPNTSVPPPNPAGLTSVEMFRVRDITNP